MPKLSSSLYLSQGDLREHPSQAAFMGDFVEAAWDSFLGQDIDQEASVRAPEPLVAIKSKEK